MKFGFSLSVLIVVISLTACKQNSAGMEFKGEIPGLLND